MESSEVKERDFLWIKKSQREAEENPKVEEIKRELNLQPNEMGILECRGRIEGEYPIYLPRDCTYTHAESGRASTSYHTSRRGGTDHGGSSRTVLGSQATKSRQTNKKQLSWIRAI